MNLNGSASRNFARHSLIIEWSASQSIPNNNSSITAKVFLKSNDGYGAMTAPAKNKGSVTVNGVTKDFEATSQLSANQKKLLTTQTFTVGHDSDGTKSFIFSTTYNINVTFAGVFYGNQTASGSDTLKTIPRASSIGSISGNQIGSVITVPITRASTSFTHDVSIKLGTETISVTGATTSASLTPNLENFCGQLPNSTSGTATVTVVTKNGNTIIGTKTKNHTIYVPESVVPSFHSISAVEKVQSLINLNLGVAKFVQGKSNVEVVVLGNPMYGSTIVEAWVAIDTMPAQNTHIGIFGLYYAPNLKGRVQISGSVRDSRGRWASGNGWIEITPFESPRINMFMAKRIGAGTTVEIRKNTFANRVMDNKTNYMVTIDRKDGNNWERVSTEVSTSAETVNIQGFLIDKSYEIKLTVGDYFQEVVSVVHISTAKNLMSFNKDIGVGIGKLNEGKAILEIDGSVKITNGTISGGVGYEQQFMPEGDMYNPAYWVSNFPLGMTIRFLSTQNVGNRPANYMLFLVMKFSIQDYRVFGFQQPSDNSRFFMLTGNQANVSVWRQINTVPV